MQAVRPGDIVFVLAGGTHPCILRPVPNSSQTYNLICECYVHGIMDREAITEDWASEFRRLPTQDGVINVWEDVYLR